MSTSKSQQAANRKWNENNLERIYLSVKKGEKDRIKKAAEMANESINSYIISAINKRMEDNN